jgi:hypothetical protein
MPNVSVDKACKNFREGLSIALLAGQGTGLFRHTLYHILLKPRFDIAPAYGCM